MEGKSANQIWKAEKKAGLTTLEFKPWMEREKAKALSFHNYDGPAPMPENKTLNDSIQNAIKDLRTQSGYKETTDDKYVLGIDKKVWMIVGVVVVVTVGVIVYKKMKK